MSLARPLWALCGCASLSTLLRSFFLLRLLLSPPVCLALGPALGELDQVYFAAWVDTNIGYSDSPLAFNARLQRNASAFHFSQDMPLKPYNYTTGGGGPVPEYLVENTATDAALFLTVFPASLTGIGEHDYNALGNQLLTYQKNYNRTVFVRWAPEMQGRWNPYGQQPSLFVPAWKALYKAVKAIAPNTIMVWAPNLGHDYPYGQTDNVAPEDFPLLDTNKDGRFDTNDDPYMPYYPGDDYVDWIGISMYFKQFSRSVNMAQPPGFCGDTLTGIDSATQRYSGYDWYKLFCASKPTKACLIAESGAAYHPNDPAGATQLEIARAWWLDCITNSTHLDRFPRIKLFTHFEFEKTEFDYGPGNLRDYRLTNNSDILQAFQTDLSKVQDRYRWAEFRQPVRPAQPQGPNSPTSTISIPTLVLQTQRNPVLNGLPSLFGTTHSGTCRIRLNTLGATALVSVTTLLVVSWEGIGKSCRQALRRRKMRQQIRLHWAP